MMKADVLTFITDGYVTAVSAPGSSVGLCSAVAIMRGESVMSVPIRALLRGFCHLEALVFDNALHNGQGSSVPMPIQ